MGATRGYYSLIQYCPDPSRAESANVGVALFCPDINFLDASISTNNERIERFFDKVSNQKMDLKDVAAAKNAMVARLRVEADSFRSIDDFEAFVRTRANEIRLTPPRPLKVADPEEELKHLFERLVGGRRKRTKSEKSKIMSPHVARLDTFLRRPSLRDRIQFDTQVIVPTLGRMLEIPYAYKNGTISLIKPESFPPEVRKAEDKAMKLAVEGNLIHREPHNGTVRKLIVLSNREGPTDGPLLKVRDILQKFNTEFVPSEEIDAFATKVEKEAQPA